ncbi:hypothetical protein H0H93_005551 [Arthromyces matolae]|nr:hypothetical protein H0H93_005551 [Arthromyces matolae]
MSSFVAFRSAALSLIYRPHARSYAVKFVKNAALAAKGTQSKKGGKNKGPLRGPDIEKRHRYVRLLDPKTGKLGEYQPTRDVLDSLSTQFYAELITEHPEPIVKVFDRYLEITRANEAAYRARETARHNINKEVQLTWEASPADIAHKIEKAREDILQGARVSIVITPKKGSKRSPPDVMRERASTTIESLMDVAKEWKEREVRAGQGLVVISLEPIKGATTSNSSTSPTALSSDSTGKRIALAVDSAPAEVDQVARRVRKELGKGGRVELVLSAAQPALTSEDELDEFSSESEPLQDASQAESVQEEEDTGRKELRVRPKALRKTERNGEIEQSIETELQNQASNLVEQIAEGAVEWQGRQYRPEAKKLAIFLEKAPGSKTEKKKYVVHKGPKPKKIKEEDIPSLTMD